MPRRNWRRLTKNAKARVWIVVVVVVLILVLVISSFPAAPA
jgi:t-SNARE complex subunit (syntaxin)